MLASISRVVWLGSGPPTSDIVGGRITHLGSTTEALDALERGPLEADVLVIDAPAPEALTTVVGAFAAAARRTAEGAGVRLCLAEGRFTLRTPPEAEELAHFLASGTQEPTRRVTGMIELMLNAIEHGNLELGFDEKQLLLRQGAWETEVLRRLGAPPYAQRQVTVELHQQGSDLELTIEDEGHGFDWAAAQPATVGARLHGRGIALARELAFERVTYQGRGNRVVALMAREM